jgi:transposase
VAVSDPILQTEAFLENTAKDASSLAKKLDEREAELVSELAQVRQMKATLRTLTEREARTNIKVSSKVEAKITAVQNERAVLAMMVKEKESLPTMLEFILERTQQPVSLSGFRTLLREAGWKGSGELLRTTLARLVAKGRLHRQADANRSHLYTLPHWKEEAP